MEIFGAIGALAYFLMGTILRVTVWSHLSDYLYHGVEDFIVICFWPLCLMIMMFKIY